MSELNLLSCKAYCGFWRIILNIVVESMSVIGSPKDAVSFISSLICAHCNKDGYEGCFDILLASCSFCVSVSFVILKGGGVIVV